MILRKTPSFSGLKPASELSSRIKRNNRRSDTQHELLLRREFSRMGLRFRKNVKTLPGEPDIVFSALRVVVFCDGDFWHGRNWRALKPKLDRGTNASYWSEKIVTNIKRDRRNTALLEKAGWYVIRLWETDIKRAPITAANLIKKVVDARRNKLVKKIVHKRKGSI